MNLSAGVRWLSAALAAAAAFDIICLDIQSRKIPNAHLRAFLAATALLYALLAVHTAMGGIGSHDWQFYRSCALHAAGACAAAVALWRLGVWPAGDAKLFILLAGLFPAAFPAGGLMPWRLTLVCLMNIFLPAAVFVILKAVRWVWMTRLRHEMPFLKAVGLRKFGEYLRQAQSDLSAAAKKTLGEIIAGARADPIRLLFFSADMLAMALLGAASSRVLEARLQTLPWAGPLAGVLVFFAWRSLSAWSRSRWMSSLLIAAVLAFAAIMPEQRAVFHGFWRWILFMAATNVGMFAVRVFFGVQERFFALSWIAFMLLPAMTPFLWPRAFGFARVLDWAFWGAVCGFLYLLVAGLLDEDLWHLPVDALHPRLILAPDTLAGLRQDPGFYEEHFRRLYPDGLTEEQVAALKEWCLHQGRKTVALKKTMPFAFWIFFGMALSALLKADVLSLALSWGRHG